MAEDKYTPGQFREESSFDKRVDHWSLIHICAISLRGWHYETMPLLSGNQIAGQCPYLSSHQGINILYSEFGVLLTLRVYMRSLAPGFEYFYAP
jgi:hypothetical protein